MPHTDLPDDVRRWIDQQDAAERDALVRTWDLAALATAPADAEATDHAWARLDALLDDGAPAAAPDAAAMQAGLDAWQTRGDARTALAPPTTVVPAARLARPGLWAGLLATAAVAIAAALWLQPVTVGAGGEVLAVVLPDGSEVSLAPGAELRHARGLRGGGRTVTLTGQGYFDVARDGRPFVVETSDAEIEVLGTEFDVRADGETVVALVEGSVRLRSDGGAVVLAPGQTSRVVAGVPTAPAATDAGVLTAFRDGAFSVVDVPLDAVARAVGDRFGRPVRLAPGVDGRRRMTLFLPSADSADVVLRDLAAYLDLRLQVTADHFDLLPR